MLYITLDKHLVPFRISRETARDLYMKVTGTKKSYANTIMDNGAAVFSDNDEIFLIICEEEVKMIFSEKEISACTHAIPKRTIQFSDGSVHEQCEVYKITPETVSYFVVNQRDYWFSTFKE